MSTIYRARYRTDRVETVAIKQVSVHDLAPAEQAEARGWLAREAGLLSSLDHPLLPNLLAAFSEGDEHYVVMPFLEGRTLKELVTQTGRPPLPDQLQWTRALTDLLVYLHGQDPPIIHRDIKPDNVLIRPDGTLALLDLGVARPLARGLPGTAIGTPGFAAPEQYQGLADERSDIYSLGATLHYMLTGYDAEQDAPFRHPPVRQLDPKVGPVTEVLVSKLLRIVPSERPQSATILRDYLMRYEDVQLHSTTVANYSWYMHRLTVRVLPRVLVSVGLAAVSTMHAIGLPGWLLSGLSSGLLGVVAAGCLIIAILALHIPRFAASTLRSGASPARLAPTVPTLVVMFGLAMLYAVAIPQATQWLLLPALLALPYAVTAVCWRRSIARLMQARQSLEVAMDISLP